ncbi:MAG: glutathione S-transferase family protein [Devosia sp.]|uniref:glutathione S-transferase family protein n=1 Tax=Devosia sp. TaxID=1871048 RepID=UPI003395C4AB
MADRTLYYTHNINPRVAVAVARHLKSPVELVRYEPMGADREAFLPLNPNSLAPLLVEDGKPLWEADAISLRLSRLAGGAFWPDEHAVEMMMWVSWSAHHFTNAGAALVWHNFTARSFMGDPDPGVVEETTNDFKRFAAILDSTLAGRDWLVGDRLTYADFRVASSLPFAERGLIPLEPYANIRAWHERLNQIDAWRDPFAGLA